MEIITKLKTTFRSVTSGISLCALLCASGTAKAQAGAAINFDGADDYVNMSTGINGSLTPLTKLTVEAWVRPTSLSGLGCIVGNYSTPSNQMQFLLRRGTNTQYQFWLGNSVVGNYTGASSVAAPTLGVWQHVAGTWDGTVASIYVNGVLSATAPVTYTSLGVCSNSVWVGADGIAENFNGDIDEIRIWNRPLCASELQNNMNAELPLPQYGLLAYYKFNQGVAGGNNAGLTTATASVGGVTGTLTNMALTGATSNWIAPGGVVSGSLASVFTGTAITVNSGTINAGQVFTMNPTGGVNYTFSSGSATVNPNITSTYTVYGYSGACLNKAYSTVSVTGADFSFDGVDDYITAGTALNASLTPLTKLSVEAWVKPNSLSGLGCVIGNYSTPGNQMQFLLRRGTSQYQFWIGTSQVGVYTGASSVASPTLGVWQHVAGTWDGTVASIYVNGVLSATAPVTYTSMGVCSNSVWIGADGIAENFNGQLDEIRVWNRALCQAEIMNNMNAELSLPQMGLLTYYRLNTGFSGASNPSVNTTPDLSPGNITGTVTNAALNGTVSNWMAAGGVTQGSSTPAFTLAGFAVSGASSVCIGSSITLTASGVNSYSWSTGALTSTVVVSPTVNSTYNVIGTATNGCVAQLVKSVTVAALPSVSASGSSSAICSGQTATLTAGGASTYSWSNGSASATTAVSPTATTVYSVIGTSGVGCVNTTTTSLIVNICTSLNEKNTESNETRLYPNPTSGNFTMEITTDAKVKISDLSGRVIYSNELEKGNYKFDLSGYENGIYLVQVRGNSQVKIYKLVKQ